MNQGQKRFLVIALGVVVVFVILIVSAPSGDSNEVMAENTITEESGSYFQDYQANERPAYRIDRHGNVLRIIANRMNEVHFQQTYINGNSKVKRNLHFYGFSEALAEALIELERSDEFTIISTEAINYEGTTKELLVIIELKKK
jgi:hypothetical protein